VNPLTPARREWRCFKCKKLLGVITGPRLHVQSVRGDHYLVGYPVTTVCRGCRALNELPKAPSAVGAS
jgi:hypothetical protein